MQCRIIQSMTPASTLPVDPPVKQLLLLFLRLVTVRNSSVSRSRAVARRSGSGSKQRRIKALASRDMDSGISGWILNMPTCRQMQSGGMVEEGHQSRTC